MSSSNPTLAELRSTVQKGRHREIGNWLARRVARPSAIYGTWLAVRLGLSAHQVTLAALAASLCGALAIGSGSRAGFVLGILLLHLGFWLDHIDGQVARWCGTSSLDGVFFDYLMHHLVNMTLGFALGYGLCLRTGNPFWCLAGFAIAAGWTFLSLQNDCRYKAFFQRLKSTTETYSIAGGSGDKPQPPATWPRRGLGVLTWPAYKLCEPHVVLVSLTILAAVAALSPSAWLESWRLAVLGMALLAPALATARVGRAIARQSVEAEFERWCRGPETVPIGRSGRMNGPSSEKARAKNNNSLADQAST
jgi:CDP-alcohol phosphatidyltransferase